MKEKLLPILGGIICICGGLIAAYLFVYFYALLYGLGSEGIGFGFNYPSLFGIGLTYILLRKYFPVLIVGKSRMEEQTFGRKILNWVLRIIIIFALLFVGALISFIFKPIS